MSKLKGEKGPAFDKVYVGEMVQDHQKDVAEFEKEATSAKIRCEELRNEYLPVLKQHLTMAELLRFKVALEQTVTGSSVATARPAKSCPRSPVSL